MQATSAAISLNVPDPSVSATFARDHLGCEVEMADDGFVSLRHPDLNVNLIFLRTGLGTFKPASIAGSAGQGTLLVFVVDDLDAEFERMSSAGANVVTPPETEPWGERFCQFADGNGLTWQLVQWVHQPA